MEYINFAANDSQYYAMITFTDSYYSSNKEKCILLDCINDVTLNSQSQITQFPLVSGKISSDHVIEQPKTLMISGKFGTYASYSGTDRVQEQFGSIQRLFERIKNQGYLCKIQKVHKKDTAESFDEHKNMVLTSISWTEQVNTLSFNLTFTEVYLVSVKEVGYETTDANAPNYQDLQQANMNQMFYSSRYVQEVVNIANALVDEYEDDLTTAAATESAAIATASTIVGAFTFGIAAVAGVAGEAAVLAIYDAGLETAEQARNAIQTWATDPQKSKALNLAIQQIFNKFVVYTFSEDGDQVCPIDSLGVKLTIKKNNVAMGSVASCTVVDYNTGEVLGQKPNIFTASWRFENETAIAQIGDIGIYILSKEGRTFGKITDYAIVLTDLRPENYRQFVKDRISTALGIE